LTTSPSLWGFYNLFPTLDSIRLALGQHDASIFFIDFLDEHIDDITHADFSAFKVTSGNFTLSFVAHIDDDPVFADTDYFARG